MNYALACLYTALCYAARLRVATAERERKHCQHIRDTYVALYRAAKVTK